MKKSGGTFEVPVRINDVVTIYFTIDSGAADVVIPSDVVSVLLRSGTVKEDDYIGKQTYTLADGSKLPSIKFRLNSLQVGDQVLTNVVASVAPASSGPLLGQSFLSRFASWTLDNGAGTLTLTLQGAAPQPVVPASAPATAVAAAPPASGAAPPRRPLRRRRRRPRRPQRP